MKAATIVGLLCAPLVWLYGAVIAAAMLGGDLLATPIVRARRRRLPAPPDAPPPSLDASLIVLNYNGEALLANLLPSLEVAVERAAGDHEIIVVDNGSTDGSAEYVAKNHPSVRLVRLPENRFFIRGNQAGVAAATRDILVFVNNDMRVEPEFLERLLQRFGPGDIFAVTAHIEMDGDRVETGRTRAWFRRGSFHFAHVTGSDAPLIPAVWAGGGSSAFDRRKFAAIGGFEELYDPCYVEDLSLSYQAWRRGYRVLFEPHSEVHHLHRATSSVVFGHRTTERINRRNLELFFWRSVTDPGMALAHAFYLPWNTLKAARRTGLSVQLVALLAALPRLPRAWLERQRSRVSYRRGDREVLRLANHVRRFRSASADRDGAVPVLLSLGRSPAAELRLPGIRVIQHTVPLEPRGEPPPEDLFGLVPRRFWDTVGNGAATDAIRDLVCETDHDVVYFRDPWAMAAAPPDIFDRASILQLHVLEAPASKVETWREQRFLRGLMRRARVTATASKAHSEALEPLAGALPLCVASPNDAETLAALCHRIVEAP